MTHAAHARALLGLGLPLIGGHLGQLAIHVTDTLMLGWYGVEALAAGVLATSFFFVLFLVGSGFAWAILPMVAAASEADDSGTIRIRRVTRMGLWLSALWSLAMLPVLWFSEAILLAIGQEAATSALAQDYLRLAMLGLLPALGVMVLKSYLSALERTRVVLWVTLAAAPVNALINYALIFGNFGMPELGVRGAAIASIAVQLVSIVGLIVYATRVFPEHTLFHRIWRADWEAFGEVFRLGWPIGLTNLAEVGLFAGSAVLMGWIGTQTLAAHGIALQWASATFMVHLGLANAATIRVGKALGRGDEMHLRRGAAVALVLSVMFSVVTICIFLSVPGFLIGLFLDPAESARAEIIAIGITLLALAALFQLADGLQVVAISLLRGVQDTRVPMVYAAFAYWLIGMPASYVLGFVVGWGASGVWLGLVFGLFVASVLLLHRFWSRPLPIAAPVSA